MLISARVEGGQLLLEVINSREPGAALRTPAPSTGVGLENARERLRLLFGTRASFALDTSRPERVTARVCIPTEAA